MREATTWAVAWGLAVAGLALGGGCEQDDAGAAADAETAGDTAAPEPDTEAPAPDAEAPDTAPPAPHVVPIGEMDETFLAGPYVMHTTTTSASIAWETQEAGDTVVEYGPTEALGLRAEGAPGELHRVTLTGLEPGSQVHYRACTGGACTRGLWLGTAPRPGQPFRFAVYGDSRSDPPQHRAVIESMVESQPTVVLHTGDVVETGNIRRQYREMHLDPARPLAHYVPIYVAIGNHEWKGHEEGVANFLDYLVFPQEAEVPRPGLSYSVTWGDAFFLLMDNTLDGLDFFFPLTDTFEAPLWDWLRERAASEEAQRARWRFAVFHYPPASPCHEDWAMLRATREHVLPLLREHGFQAILAGHVHDYERQSWDGLRVVVTGGGGAGLEAEAGCTRELPELELLRSAHHHVVVDVAEDSALVQAIGVDGEVLDAFALEP